VAAEISSEVAVHDRLQALGVVLVAEWDTLAFLYSHAANLGTSAQIAASVGYGKAEIGAALHRLEVLGLIQRSRACQGTRIYRFSEPPEPSRQSCLLELMSLAQNRMGRLLLLKHLKRPHRGPLRSRDLGLRLA
jgi:predicted transcriptional regulator